LLQCFTSATSASSTPSLRGCFVSGSYTYNCVERPGDCST
jgi:hypothetical protein